MGGGPAAGHLTNNGHHFGFYQELEIRLKLREIVIFLCLTWKQRINRHFA